MFEYIENLKTKPEHIRKRFAFLVSFTFTGIIFAGWIASYSLKSSSTVLSKEESKKEVVVETPVNSLTASVSGLFKDIKNAFSGSNKVEYSSDAFEITGGKR